MTPQSSQNDRPDVLVFPPALPLSGLVVGIVLEYIFPLAHRVEWLPPGLRGLLAALVFLPGLVVMVGSRFALSRAKTNVNPRLPALCLVEAWPYTWSRNPMYLGGGLMILGVGLAFRLYWILLLYPIIQTILHFGVVLREERYLERKFSPAYLNYKARVRRWL